MQPRESAERMGAAPPRPLSPLRPEGPAVLPGPAPVCLSPGSLGGGRRTAEPLRTTLREAPRLRPPGSTTWRAPPQSRTRNMERPGDGPGGRFLPRPHVHKPRPASSQERAEFWEQDGGCCGGRGHECLEGPACRAPTPHGAPHLARRCPTRSHTPPRGIPTGRGTCGLQPRPPPHYTPPGGPQGGQDATPGLLQVPAAMVRARSPAAGMLPGRPTGARISPVPREQRPEPEARHSLPHRPAALVRSAANTRQPEKSWRM